MKARRRFPDTESDDSVALLLNDSIEFEEKKKYSLPTKWNIGGFLQNQLLPVVYSSLPQQQTTSPLFQPQAHNQQSYYGNVVDTDFDKENQPEEIEVMTARDRTLEFSNAIRTLQSRNLSRAVNIKDAKKATQLQNYSEFMTIAKHVGKNIASTYSKLEKLTMRK